MAIPLRQQALDGQDPGRRQSLRHSTVWPDGTATSAAAREAAACFFAEVRLSEQVPPVQDLGVDRVQLVVSELVTNACRHAPGPCGLDLELTAGGRLARVTVWDTSPQAPAPQPPDPGRVGGHGLEIVLAVSRHLHVEPRPQGKNVCVEVDLS